MGRAGCRLFVGSHGFQDKRRRFLGGHRELDDRVTVFVPERHIRRTQPQDQSVLALRDE